MPMLFLESEILQKTSSQLLLLFQYYVVFVISKTSVKTFQSFDQVPEMAKIFQLPILTTMHILQKWILSSNVKCFFRKTRSNRIPLNSDYPRLSIFLVPKIFPWAESITDRSFQCLNWSRCLI